MASSEWAMSTDPLDALLESLCSGDVNAAEHVFRAYEPILRKVVRRRLPAQLRSRFDSIDIVQSIWADLLRGFRDAGWRFTDAAHLQAFLVKVTRNRFVDRCRTHLNAAQREQPLATALPEEMQAPSLAQPSEVAQANDLWQRMLALCPPAHRDMLILRRDGMSVPDIAARIGLHEDSIRRILRDIARQLARHEEASAAAADHM
jgi:RNA polymerase sigma-70 factor (ECF subfamily)